MTKKKAIIEETFAELLENSSEEGTTAEEIVVEETKTQFQYEVGDNVLVRGIGNKASDGSGWEVRENMKEIRRIAKIIEGKLYPYEIGDPYGSTIGYFKEESIIKLPNY